MSEWDDDLPMEIARGTYRAMQREIERWQSAAASVPVPIMCDRGEWQELLGETTLFVQEQLRAKDAENAELRKALAIFAAIKPSSFFPADGSENEGYKVYVYSINRDNWVPGSDTVDFTGRDLAEARRLTK